jgi:hypothetical protein
MYTSLHLIALVYPIMSLERIVAYHARLKHRIHSFRYPLHTRSQRFLAGCVYFTVPCAFGYVCMTLTNKVRDQNLGASGSRENLVAKQHSWTHTQVRAEAKTKAKVEQTPS